MDGAGRLARSMRSLRPQADLKAATIGALILLREHVFTRRRASARPLIERETPPRLIAWIERHVPRRAGIAATAMLLLASAGFGVVKGGHVEEVKEAFNDTRNALANAVGFRITAVVINGRKQLTQDDVLAIGGVNGRSSLLFLDAAALRDKLKANPWIAEATVLKLYPGRLQIDLVERSAVALCSKTAGSRSSPTTASFSNPMSLGASCRCRWWSARAPKRMRGIFSHCLRAIRRFTRPPRWRFSSASGAGICGSRTGSISAYPSTTSATRSPN